jgi:hypothetical protein
MDRTLILLIIGGFILSSDFHSIMRTSPAWSNGYASYASDSNDERTRRPARVYQYPEFYRGMYLTVASAINFQKLRYFVDKAISSNINTLVLDVQSARNAACMVPESHVRYCIDHGIHPIARIVVFPDGLRRYPVPPSYLEDKLSIAEDACRNGFREIQFDYIRFHDSGSTRRLTYAQRYRFIEGFLSEARNRVKNYNVRIAVDVFGRVPLNTDDIIGQKIESLDKVVDMICPMAYPSHYTWSRKYYSDPYYTVRKTSTQARLRTRNAIIVTYIQAFRMKMMGIPFEKYLFEELKAVRDSGIRGFILWNARQDYDIPLDVVKSFYSKGVSEKERSDFLLID